MPFFRRNFDIIVVRLFRTVGMRLARVALKLVIALTIMSGISTAVFAKAKDSIRLTWQSVANASRYEVNMSKYPDFKRVELETTTPKVSFRWDKPAPGTFYWRVRVVHKDSPTGEWSDTGKIEVKVSPPESVTATQFVYTKLPKQERPPSILLKWKNTRWAKSYEVNVSPESKFDRDSRSIKSTINQTSVDFEKDGNYFWRVRALDNGDRPLGRFSKPYTLSIRGAESPTRSIASETAQPEQTQTSEEKPIKSIVKSPRKWRLSTGIAFTLINYEEKDYLKFSETVLTPKVSGTYFLGNSGWSVNANAFISALVISTNNSAEQLQFLGSNFRIGSRTRLLPKPWTLSLNGGVYFITVFKSKSENLGFKNMVGPQFFPTLSYRRKDGSELFGYFKYSPVTSGSLSPSFKSYEQAFGGSYLFKRGESARRLAVDLDLSRISINYENRIYIKSLVYSIGMSVYW